MSHRSFAGLFLSLAPAVLHLTERFELSDDASILRLTQVYEDPETFEGRAARQMSWSKRPGEYALPYDCDPSYGG